MFGNDNPTGLIKKPVGNNVDNDPQDVFAVKKRFSDQGYYKQPIENGYIDRELDDAIWSFQKDNDLKQDGYMNPDGETERALFSASTQDKEQTPENTTDSEPDAEPEENPEISPEQDQEKPEERSNKNCEELRIELENERIQYRSLQEQLLKIGDENNQVLKEFNEIKDKLSKARKKQAFDTIASTLGPGKLKKAVDAIGNFAINENKITELTNQEDEYREKYRVVRDRFQDIQNWLQSTDINVKRLLRDIEKNGC